MICWLIDGKRDVGILEILMSFSSTSINQSIKLYLYTISVDVNGRGLCFISNAVSLYFNILQVILCYKFLLRHLIFLPVESLHGVRVRY